MVQNGAKVTEILYFFLVQNGMRRGIIMRVDLNNGWSDPEDPGGVREV